MLLTLTSACGSNATNFESTADAGDFDDGPVRVVGSDASTRRADASVRDAGLGTRGGDVDADTIDAPGAAVSHDDDAGSAPAVVIDAAMMTSMADAPDAANSDTTPPASSSVRDAQASEPPPPAAASSDAATPPTNVPDAAAQPDAAQPDAGVPDAAVPDAAQPGDAAPPSAHCTAGHYSGSFQGQVAAGGSVTLTVQGQLAFDLTASADGSELAIDNGTVMATDAQGVPVQGTLTGHVDCASGMLDDGALTGTYGSDPASLLSFSGAVTGTYEDDPPTLSGSWSVTVALNGTQATGSFDSALQN